MDMELWGNDGERDFKICEVGNRQYGSILSNALLLAQRSGQQGFNLTHIWLRDMSNPRKPVMLDHRPVDHTPWGDEKLASDVAGARKVLEQMIAEQEVETTIHAVMARIPEGYITSFEITHDAQEDTYSLLLMPYTLVFKGVSGSEAIERTRRYVAEREESPTGWNLPVGVINGIYD